ncbi:monofunctional biosynthetic peptidoglycan transglycosylase [Pontibacterium granulatum]|uniref:monofunctional biosynthetic peptidoglycan transglycosylase n=1 Tax=Pontibacterium granulatum TaxID=2036029 RepID=UPI00249CD0DD|nr:monofunctional biosynthetic peptidoglycan transglycosylase [Pontibacterium granulatum]MDI3325060.1 monofunctional biosynthetic peptidoglycan transglycosylase [Pontibacterium granulatum]
MLKKALTLLSISIASCFSLLLLSMVVLKWVDVPTSAFMIAHNLNSLMDNQLEPVRYEWVDLEEIPASVQAAVIASEDQKFPVHYGIDVEATQEAISNALNGRKGRGGSTITQQVVKNLYLWEGRSYLRKALEIPLAMLLEQVWDKNRILEVYLNIAQFGPRDFGVKRGALYQLNKPIETISRREGILLASVLPAPTKYKARYPSRRLANKQARILRHLSRYDGDLYLQALNPS